jgi:hypothetical protein
MAIGLGVIAVLILLASAMFLATPPAPHDSPGPGPATMAAGISPYSIPLRTNTVTEADVRNRGRDFRTRLWLQGYEDYGDRDHACDAEVVAMLRMWIDSNFGPPNIHRTNVIQWCDPFAAGRDCADPLLLTVLGLHAQDTREQVRRLERALAGYPRSRHKAYPKLNAAVSLLEATEDGDRANALLGSAMAFMRDCFADGSFRPEDQAEIAEIFINGWGNNLLSRISLAWKSGVHAHVRKIRRGHRAFRHGRAPHRLRRAGRHGDRFETQTGTVPLRPP